MRSPRTRVLLIPLAVVALFAGSFAGSAWGSHKFSDVPDSNPFHDAIGAIADAGITTGFPDGTYHPNDAVNRQSMAAFMHRGFTRTDGSNTFTSGITDTTVHNLASATVTAGAASGTGGFVVVIADVTFSTASETLCPCKVGLSITDGSLTSGQRNATIANVASPDGSAFTSVTSTFIFSLPAGQTRTYTAQGFRLDSISGSPSTTMAANLVALYVPFSGDGDNSL